MSHKFYFKKISIAVTPKVEFGDYLLGFITSLYSS